MKRVLMIAYYFPPIGGVGVIRPVKFAKYLRAYGWDPIVLTVHEIAYPLRDPDLLLEVYDVPIFRTGSLDPTRILWKLGRRPRFTARARQWSLLGSNFFLFPDSKVPWLPFAVRRGREIARRLRPDALYSVSPPFTSHLIAWLLHRRFRIPWVADFTDPWPTGHRTPTPFHRLLYRRLRSAIVRRCTVPVKVYEGLPLGPRAVWIEHGYDPDEFAGPPRSSRFSPDELHVVYTGSLVDREEGFRLFLKALRQVPRVRLWFAGPSAETLERWAEEEGVRDRVQTLGFRPHHEIPDLLKAGDVLLFVSPYETSTLKLYEYLGAGRPILLMAPPGSDAIQLTRRYPEILRPVTRLDDIVSALRDLWFQRGRPLVPPPDLTWPAQAQRLATLLNTL